MGLGKSRFRALGLIGAVSLALVLAACEGTPDPTSTPAPTATAVPTATAAPTATLVPVPTAAPTSTAAPTATRGPASASAPPPETGRGLLEKLSLIPAEFRDKGIWFGDLGRALEMAGVQPPRSRDDLTDRDVRDAYNEARDGIVMAPALLVNVYNEPSWGEVFGFNGYEVTQAVSLGDSFIAPNPFSSSAYLEGDFDDAAIRQKLQGLGYEEIEASGLTYFSKGKDNEWPSLSGPDGFALGDMNRVYVSGTSMIAARNTEFITAMLATWANESPSLAEDDAFSGLANALGDPLSAGLFTRETILTYEPALTDLTRYEKPEEWSTLHEWSDMGAGYGRGEEGEWWVISLFYPDSDAASADADELIQRMQGYDSAFPEFVEQGFLVQRPIDQSCSELTADTRQHEGGSILSVRCEMNEDGLTALQLADLRDVGFLVP